MRPPHFKSNYEFGYGFSGVLAALGWVTIAAGAVAILAFAFSVDRYNPLNWAGIIGAVVLSVQGFLLIATSTFLKAHFDSAAATKSIEWYVAKSFGSDAPTPLHTPTSYKPIAAEQGELESQANDINQSGLGLQHRGHVIPMENGKYVVNSIRFHGAGPAKEYLNRRLDQGDPVDIPKL